MQLRCDRQQAIMSAEDDGYKVRLLVCVLMQDGDLKAFLPSRRCMYPTCHSHMTTASLKTFSSQQLAMFDVDL